MSAHISLGEVTQYLSCLKKGKSGFRLVPLGAKSYFLQLEIDFVLQSGWRLLDSLVHRGCGGVIPRNLGI